MNILTIERVWEDADFFEIELVAQSKIACARVKSYTTTETINELALKIATFPQKFDDRYLWENGIKGNASTPYVSLEFWCKDRQGHIMIEVYMELDDGASYNKHNCCFYIETELGLLNSFGKSLISLSEEGVGKKVALGIC